MITSDFAEPIDYVLKESHAVWKAVAAFARRENEEGRDVLIEGVAVLPELVNQLDDIPYRVVFLGNQGEHHKENIKKSAEQYENDWMRDRSDQYISIFALFVNQVSVNVELEANKYGYEYIELSKKQFTSIPEKVMMSFGLSTK